ncbi:mitochondrial 54S ribosomal protein bL19m [Saccharomyces eubayanus]|uniref:mitochondrial 54S ribosomal protein bL19m n=1 Tax=Saccharomyces eubayanus TaxID=1080349 RepID=UPI0006C55EEA|nr:IMG1-like protein [Saccharomyces eubayanus]KOH00702.1 IMG1-like protein [Saccharomyces eubayanus]
MWSRNARLLVRSTRTYIVPTTTRKTIPVYPPVERIGSAQIMTRVAQSEIETLDPGASRRKLISKKNKDRLKAGDVVRVVYDSSKCSYDPFVGYILSIDRKQLVQDASLLLRNQIAKTAVEIRVPLFSPLIERIDLLRPHTSNRQRNKHYYIRGTKLDVGDLEASLRRKK